MRLLNHEQANELFSDYWERELSAEEQAALEEHLSGCVVCRREYEEFKQAMSAVSGLHKLAAPPDFADAVGKKIRRRSRGRFFGPRRLAERIPWEQFSLLMLAILLAIYIVLGLPR